MSGESISSVSDVKPSGAGHSPSQASGDSMHGLLRRSLSISLFCAEKGTPLPPEIAEMLQRRTSSENIKELEAELEKNPEIKKALETVWKRVEECRLASSPAQQRLAVTINCNSFIRNLMSVVPFLSPGAVHALSALCLGLGLSIGGATVAGQVFAAGWVTSPAMQTAAGAAVPWMTFAAGVMAFGAGLWIAYNKSKDFYSACRDGDVNGMINSMLGVLIGGQYSTLGAALSLAVAPHTVYSGISASVASLGSTVLYYSGIGLYATVGAMGVYGTWTSGRFRSQFKAKLQKEPTHESLATTLVWLKQQATLSEAEEKAVREKAEKKGKNVEEAVARAVRCKLRQLQFRTNSDACKRVAVEIHDDLIAQVRAGDAHAIAIANGIVREVSKANFIRLAINITLIVIAILGILAFLFTGPVGHILFATVAVAWMTVDHSSVTNWYGRQIWTLHEKICPFKFVFNPNPPLHPQLKEAYRQIVAEGVPAGYQQRKAVKSEEPTSAKLSLGKPKGQTQSQVA